MSHAGSSPTTLWRHRDFLKLWIGQTISVFGSQFTGLALPLIAALTLNASPAEMGILLAADTAPFLLVGLFAGVWVDRLRRRPILIVGDVGRALLLLTIPLTAFAGRLSMPQLYVVGFLYGVLTVFFDVAYQAYLPALVERGHLVEGNSKLEASRSTAQVAGPGVAGLLIQALSAPFAIVLDALSFFISALFLGMIRRSEGEPVVTRAPMLAEVREGLKSVFDNRLLRAIAGTTATSNFFGSAIGALYILFATQELGLAPAAIGLVFSVGNIGALAGGVLAGTLARRLGLGRVIVGAAFLGALGNVPVVFATRDLALPVLAVGWVLVAMASPIYNINQVSLRQAITPLSLQGRMNATMRFVVWGTLPLGGLVGGFIGGAIGLRSAIALAAAGGLTAFLWVLRSPVRTLTRIPDSATTE